MQKPGQIDELRTAVSRNHNFRHGEFLWLNFQPFRDFVVDFQITINHKHVVEPFTSTFTSIQPHDIWLYNHMVEIQKLCFFYGSWVMIFNHRGVLWLKIQPQKPPVAKIVVAGHRWLRNNRLL